METPIISILRDHLHKSLTPQFDTDWGEILALSKRHGVTAIVYEQCKAFIPKEYIDEFIRISSTTLFFYANRMKMKGKIDAALEDIEHFSIKGSSVAQFYPIPAYRTMGDTDIVVHSEDRAEADRRLRDLGLECAQTPDSREWQYYYNGMEFELHTKLVYTDSINVSAQETYFNDFWKHVNDNALEWNFHLLFLILHLRKHFMKNGVGVRQFMDIAVLCSNGPVFDWLWIKGELKKLRLWTFTERVLALNEYWFGIRPPLTVLVPPEGFFSSATDLILKNGVFGFDNEENRDNMVVNTIRGKGNSKKAMLKTAVRKLFPDYKTMKSVSFYSYLSGHPHFLPIAWIHRAVRSIGNKRVKSDVKTLVNTSFTDQETVKRREHIYELWGL